MYLSILCTSKAILLVRQQGKHNVEGSLINLWSIALSNQNTHERPYVWVIGEWRIENNMEESFRVLFV